MRAGEPADVVALASKVMDSLEAEGHIAKGSIVDFARSEIGIAVPAGSPRPGVESEQAVRRAMTEARRICYSTGPSGDHLRALCEKWGVTEAVLQRALVAPPGVPVASLVARGEADLGFQQLSELIGQPGIEVVGPLPPEIQSVTVFSAGVSTASHEQRPRRLSSPISRPLKPPTRNCATAWSPRRSRRNACLTRLQGGSPMIIDCPRPLHDRAEGARGLAQPADRRHQGSGRHAEGVRSQDQRR